MGKKLWIIIIFVLVILGVFIFLFVDFQSTFLPNEITLNNDLESFVYESMAFEKDFENQPENANSIILLFKNINSEAILISAVGNTIESEEYGVCKSYKFMNLDSDISVGCDNNVVYDDIDLTCLNETGLGFNETGYMQFECPKSPGLEYNKQFEGEIKINYKDPNGEDRISSGNARLLIQG